MRTNLWRSAWIAAWITILAGLAPVLAQSEPESDSPRIALVVGLQSYRTPLPTAANDAGLVAQTLAAAGFDVTGARDLGGDDLRRTFREFLDKAAAGGPRGVALVYLAGRAVQYEGENYLIPVDARLARDTDVPIEALRLGDFTRALAATNLGVKIVVVDGAYAGTEGGERFGAGLALVDADPGSLLAFNAAPGQVAPLSQGPYGLYASALVAAIKQGGVPIEEVFARVRVAVNTDSQGTVVPWTASKLLTSFTFFDRSSDAPAVGSAQIPFASLGSRPLRDFSPEQAYDVAIARDTLPVYEEYLTVFPKDPLARRIRIALAQRREALIWRDVLRARSAPALWTYLDRYPRGPHAAEAQRRLARLGAGHGPPSGFAPIGFEVQPPLPEELEIVEPGYRFAPDLAPPPEPPVFLLPPRGARLDLPPPRAPDAAGLLPLPAILAIPFVRPILAPGAIRPPRHVPGGYRQPRPFGASPNNDRLVPQRADAPEPIRGPLPPDEPRQPNMPVVPSLPVPQQVPPKDRRPRVDRPGAEQPLAPGQLPGAGQLPGSRQRPAAGERPAVDERPPVLERPPMVPGPGTAGQPRTLQPRPLRPGPDAAAPGDALDRRQLPRAGRQRREPANGLTDDASRPARLDRTQTDPGIVRPERPRPLQNERTGPIGQPPVIGGTPPALRRPLPEQLPRQTIRPADRNPGFDAGLGQPRMRPELRPQGLQPAPRQLAPAGQSPAFGGGQMGQPRIGIQRPADLGGGNRLPGRRLGCGGPGQPPC